MLCKIVSIHKTLLYSATKLEINRVNSKKQKICQKKLE